MPSFVPTNYDLRTAWFFVITWRKLEDRGKPSKKFKDNELQALLDEDDTQTQQELADQLNVSQKAVSIRLKAMGKIQKVGKWVPHEPTNSK